MNFRDLEIIYTRAWQRAFCKKKLAVMFAVLCVCGLIALFFWAIGQSANAWIRLACYFFPAILLFLNLLSSGIFFARIYYHELKGDKFSYRELFFRSLKLLLLVGHAFIPVLFVYLAIWLVIGFFFLIGQIPYIAVVFSFAPFLLILVGLALAALSLFFLFFATPQIAFTKVTLLNFIQGAVSQLKSHLLSYLILFVIATLPEALLSLLIIASSSFIPIEAASTLASILHWLFLIIPIGALLTPPFLFFFNFAVEGYNLLRSRHKI